MTGDAFIRLAGKMAAQSSTDEAALRTAVSRAYYGAFHIARQFLEELGVSTVANAQIHGFVRHCLIGSGDAELQQAGSLLSTLHTDRIRADYRLHLQQFASLDEVRGSIESADRVRAILENSQRSDSREALRAAIESYLHRRAP